MVIALNAGSNPNGQAPSIGVHGDGKDAENSFFGNFGDLLTLISADAENALHENNPEAKLTAKQTNEALLALVEGGSDDAKLAISSILKRVTFEDSNQLNLPVKEDIQTSSFLEAKIESKLEQQNLLKPLKELEFFSLADLESFVKGLEQSNVKVFTESPLNKNSVLIETPLAGIAADMDKEHYASAAGAVVTTSNLVSNAAVATSPDIVGTTAVSRISEPFSLAVGINDPISVANYPVDEKGQIIPVDEKGQIIPGGEKDQIILDVVKDILQVNSATLTISKKGPSEVIFDLRDLKEVILQKFPSSSRSEKEVKLPLELVIPYTLPIKIENNLAENSLTELDANKFNKVEVTKITLDRNLIELQVPDEINVIENTNKDQKSFTVKGGELLLNPSPELQRKLVIGIAIPKGSSVNELPDFVKIQVSMDNIKTLTDPMTPKPNTTKEYLTSNLIEMPRGLLQDNNLGHLVKNMQVLLTALGEQNNELVDDINIVSINKFSKPSQQTVQNLVSKGPVEAETLSNSFINRPLSAPVTMLEKSTVPEYSEPKAQFNGQDRLASILSIGLTAASDTKKHNVTSRAATSVLALGARVNFFMSNNKNSLDPEAKENINSFSTKPSSMGNTYSENVFEMFNNKNATPKFLDPAEAKNLFQSQNNIAIPAQASDKFINSSLMAGERVLSSNNMPLTPALVENKISLYEAQYASRLGMAVVEKVKTGQENFDIHLTPESFGKIKVNVNLDFRAIDVKIFTETLGAAAIFKDHENTLQQIMEQNGMKLASFTVGSQSSNDQQRQFANQNKDKPIGKTNGRGNKVMTTSNQSESSTSGQSGLNLIA